MKIVTCVKQVHMLEDEIEFTDDQRDVDPYFLDPAVNEWDTHAIEEGLRIKERAGAGEVVAITVGDANAEDALRRALAMGADRAIRVDLGTRASLDPITVGRALATVLRDEAPDLVLTGVQSSDSVQAATGTVLAELLDLPVVAVVIEARLDPASTTMTVRRELEGGLVDVVNVDLPAVLTVQTGINEPRYANLRAIKQALAKELKVVTPAAVGEAGYRVRAMSVPPKGAGAELIEGAPSDIARRIHEIVKERLS